MTYLRVLKRCLLASVIYRTKTKAEEIIKSTRNKNALLHNILLHTSHHKELHNKKKPPTFVKT